MTNPACRFPWWVPAGAAVLALAYLPTLRAPFDFIDDGDLVYPAPPGTTLRGHAELWWQRVAANVEHLGPFRPALWAHWQVQANLFGGDPLKWRAFRLCWCALAAGMLLWLFRELGIPPPAALLAGAAAMWNPYRNEVWTSLTLSEGVVMPYALFALVAARRAAQSSHPWRWDLAGLLCVLVALGCKNTFAAVVPAQIALRLWPEHGTWRESVRANCWRAALFALTLVLPVGHFVYFKLNWHPGQYATPGPSAAQLVRYLGCLKGAMGLDFLGAGVALAAGVVWWSRRPTSSAPLRAGRGGKGPSEHEDESAAPEASHADSRSLRGGGWGVGSSPALLCAGLLVTAGVVVYLPVGIVSGRYAMPAVWGPDILLALLLAALWRVPVGVPRSAALVAVCAGLVAVLVVNVNRQERAAGRSRMLWQVARHVEATAPPGATVAWVGGDPAAGGLGVEEGIHMQWHLAHRGRADVRIALCDSDEQPVRRVEVPPPAEEPLLRVAASRPADPAWEPDRSFAVVYQFGRKRYDCHVSRRSSPPLHADETYRAEAGRLFRAMMPSPSTP